MSKVYMECFDEQELPDHVPREHPPRERSNYSVDRSLAELDVDRDELKHSLDFYYQWLDTLN